MLLRVPATWNPFQKVSLQTAEAILLAVLAIKLLFFTSEDLNSHVFLADSFVLYVLLAVLLYVSVVWHIVFLAPGFKSALQAVLRGILFYIFAGLLVFYVVTNHQMFNLQADEGMGWLPIIFIFMFPFYVIIQTVLIFANSYLYHAQLLKIFTVLQVVTALVVLFFTWGYALSAFENNLGYRTQYSLGAVSRWDCMRLAFVFPKHANQDFFDNYDEIRCWQEYEKQRGITK